MKANQTNWKAIYRFAPVALLLAACAQPTSAESPVAAEEAQAETHIVSGLEIIPLTISSDDETHIFRVEVAATPQDQAQGLMFRTEMGEDEGMIFPLARVRMASFWMRNTVIPLDIIFIGPDNRILNIAENTTPYSEESIPSAAPAMAVLELIGGRTAELGIAPGDLVQWEVQ